MDHRPGAAPRDLIGKPLTRGRGAMPGLTITTREESTMPKAERDGVYVLNGHRYKARKGDALPAGAEMVPEPEERAQGKAPENKARKGAPETKSKD